MQTPRFSFKVEAVCIQCGIYLIVMFGNRWYQALLQCILRWIRFFRFFCRFFISLVTNMICYERGSHRYTLHIVRSGTTFYVWFIRLLIVFYSGRYQILPNKILTLKNMITLNTYFYGGLSPRLGNSLV